MDTCMPFWDQPFSFTVLEAEQFLSSPSLNSSLFYFITMYVTAGTYVVHTRDWALFPQLVFISFNPHNAPMKWVLSLSAFYSRGY